MATPKRRTTRAKRKMRRANHDKVSPPTIVACPNCGETMIPHRVCPSCGHYNGEQIIEIVGGEQTPE
ncbi:MAG: 50S ribosomal protein L32 [Sandaracinaceae bacterium]|nr:50S ribosomal protein L32 [Sandaracinaceae bacterium]